MLFITQLIYVKEGKEDMFYQFESMAIPLIKKYNGQLLLRVRPTADTIVENTINKPFEIHLVAFETDTELEQFMKDEERNRFLHLKEQSIQSALLIKGIQIG